MRKLSIAAMLFVFATMSFGQVPSAVFNVPRADLYVGYVATFPDYGNTSSFLDTTYQFNGAEVALTKNLTRHLSVSASALWVSGNAFSAKEFSGTVGPKVYLLTSRLRPYLIGEVGYSRLTATGMYNADHHPPIAPNVSVTEQGMSARFGGGFEMDLTHRIYWRVIQIDEQPQPWARHTPFYDNLTSGIGVRF